MSKKIEKIIDELIDQYTLADSSNKPWIIGFSGGKDSTVLLTLVWKALEKIKNNFSRHSSLKRKIYVVSNDTLVENPIIKEYVEEVLEKIEKAAREQHLPIFVKKTIPKIEETFWVNVLGKGYPIPNNSFRWCTDKLKIKPTTQFLLEQIDELGEAIILIGTRSSESASRAKSIKRHEIKGKRLTKHPNQHNTLVYSPIKDLSLEEIWFIINTFSSPWGSDNSRLFKIYANASADDYECPTVVTDKTHNSCGQSRFGCWTCTVVKEDKSMSALIKNGEAWLYPLLKFRDSLVKERNISANRMATRRNGQPAVTDDGHNQGAYTPEYRAIKLKELLEIQKEIQKTKPTLQLITIQELIAIQVYWYRDGIFNFKVGNIYFDVYGHELGTKFLFADNPIEQKLLKEVCKNEPRDYDLLKNLLNLQQSKTLLLANYGLLNDIEKRIEEFIRYE